MLDVYAKPEFVHKVQPLFLEHEIIIALIWYK